MYSRGRRESLLGRAFRKEKRVIDIKELGYKVQAKYPLIHVETHEEERFLHYVRSALGEGRTIWEWSATEGLATEAKDGRRQISETEDFVAALLQVKRLASEKDGDVARRQLIVLKDAQPYMDYAIVRRHLRDLSILLPHTNTVVVLLGPELRIPTDLEKAITVYEFPLPDEEEMRKLAQAVQHRNHHRIKPAHDETHLGKVARAALGLTRDEAENVLAKSATKHGRLDLAEISAEKRELLKKAGLEVREPRKKLCDLGGLGDLKDYLARVNKVRTSPEAKKYGLTAPRGIALLGPPGNGKSAICDAIAAEFEVPLIVFDVGQFQGSLVGESQSKLRNAFRRINAIGPSVVRFDEMEKMFAGMTGPATDSGVKQEMGGMTLTWLQERPEGSYVVATMNRVIDAGGNLLVVPEMLRKGRWDELWILDLPETEQKAEILGIHLKARGRDPRKFDLAAISREAEGFSGSELEQAIVEALFYAFYEDREVETADILEVVRRTSPIAAAMKEEIDRLRDWAVSRNIRQASAKARKSALRTGVREVS